MGILTVILVVLLVLIIASALSGRFAKFTLSEALLLCIVLLLVYLLFGGNL